MRRIKKLIIVFSSIVLFSALLISCGKNESSETTGNDSTSPVSSGSNWWDKFGKPQYGGTVTYHMNSLADSFDPYYPWGAGAVHYYWYEHMFTWDWTIDRNKWSYKSQWATPDFYEGMLVESWDWPDPQTMIAKLRKGIHWQNKQPVNGREFTAEDVVFHYDRVFGTGNGFTKPNPVLSAWGDAIKKVTAKDKYTVEIKFKNPTFYLNISAVTDISPVNIIECPETVKKDIKDWKNAAGTGAYMITNFIPNSSMTLAKNQDYWRFDKRHPENRLPYIDTVKVVCIPDMATTVAALRTGKIDMADRIPWQQAQSLAKTNPKLRQDTLPWIGMALNMRIDKKPFNDINVRKALQMSIDRQTIAKTYYNGTVEGKPAGLIPPVYKGWTTPYDELPSDLKEEYSFNPEKAKKLLTKAGYPNGFKTNVVAASINDLQLLQLIKSEFKDIGVDMEIKVMEPRVQDAFIQAKKHDQMATAEWVAFPKPPQICFSDFLSSEPRNSSCNNDTKYEELVEKMKASEDITKAQKASIKTDLYALQQHWGVVVVPTSYFVISQPYLKGYEGENIGWNQDLFWAGFWIDKDLKKEMR